MDAIPKWLKALDAVKTTKADARQIKKRNRQLLTALDEAVPYLEKGKKPPRWGVCVDDDTVIRGFRVGCPQCQKVDFDCEECAWYVFPGAPGWDNFQCVCAKFDGVRLDDVNHAAPLVVIFEKDWEQFKAGPKECAAEPEALKECVRDIRKFLKGHVKWADRVLNRGNQT